MKGHGGNCKYTSDPAGSFGGKVEISWPNPSKIELYKHPYYLRELAKLPDSPNSERLLGAALRIETLEEDRRERGEKVDSLHELVETLKREHEDALAAKNEEWVATVSTLENQVEQLQKAAERTPSSVPDGAHER